MSNTSCDSTGNSLEDYLNYINSFKKTKSAIGFNLQAPYQNVCRLQDVRNLAPSGPRRPGEGVEDEEQGIVLIEKSEQGAIYVYLTLLAAGFVIGPKGRSIHQICHLTGADIRSWSTYLSTNTKQPVNALRVFQIQGKKDCVLEAIKIIVCAVDRYKELSEGKYEGQVVDKEQTLFGIIFHYQPPPKHVVPNAARIKSEGFLDRPAMQLCNGAGIPRQGYYGDQFYSYTLDKEGFGGMHSMGTNLEDSRYLVLSNYFVPQRPLYGYVQVPFQSNYQQYYYQNEYAPSALYKNVEPQLMSSVSQGSTIPVSNSQQGHAARYQASQHGPFPISNTFLTQSSVRSTNLGFTRQDSYATYDMAPTVTTTNATVVPHTNTTNVAYTYPLMYTIADMQPCKCSTSSPTSIEEEFRRA